MPSRKSRTPTVQKGKRGRKPPPPGETRRQAFIRICTGRTTSALDAIRVISNLARGAYDWSMEDVDRVAKTLHQQIDLMVEEFKKAQEPVSKELVPFSLADE